MSCTTLCDNTCHNCKNGPFKGLRLKPDYLAEISLAGQIPEIQGQASRLSISGVQPKILASIQKGKLVLSDHGEYILKPSPGGTFRLIDDAPANEHLTMRMATNIFKIETAINGLIGIEGQLVYITRRFDITKDNTRTLQEDFAQLANRSAATHGSNFKYDYSYEQFAEIVNNHFAAPGITLSRLFELILFNYYVGNGDAHLKNFSGYQTPLGDMMLTPAYDLLSTFIHTPNEAVTALPFFEGHETQFFTANGFPGAESFLALAERFNIPNPTHILKKYTNEENLNLCLNYIEQSALSNEAKTLYAQKVRGRNDILSR